MDGARAMSLPPTEITSMSQLRIRSRMSSWRSKGRFESLCQYEFSGLKVFQTKDLKSKEYSFLHQYIYNYIYWVPAYDDSRHLLFVEATARRDHAALHTTDPAGECPYLSSALRALRALHSSFARLCQLPCLRSTRSFNGCVQRNCVCIHVFQDLVHPVGDITNHPGRSKVKRKLYLVDCRVLQNTSKYCKYVSVSKRLQVQLLQLDIVAIRIDSHRCTKQLLGGSSRVW